MLDSIVQQLAGDIRMSSLDAYSSLCGTMKAYEGVPEPKDMAENMALIMQFLRRDLLAQPPEIGPVDTNLSLHALKLLVILVWNRRTSELLTDEFRAFILERSILVLQEHRLPKPIVMSYLQTLAIQDFRPKIMTSDRAHRIFAALDTMTEHVKGNAVVCQRLLVYRRLIDQAKSVMISNAQVWMEHMLAGMLSSTTDTRSKAISLGAQAGFVLGSNPAIAASMRDVLDRQIDDGEKVIVDMCKRLTKMISSSADGPSVPQIWAIMILLLRSLKPSLESWEHFKAWIHIEQKCFNCSNASVKYQANIAWNRFVFAIQPGQGTGLPMTKLLGAPITLQLEKYRPENKGKQSVQSAISSYYNLLYYSLRPAASHQQLDVFWDHYIDPVFNGPLGSGPISCEILSYILWNEKPEVWSENRANEAPTLRPTQLPILDCKWIRSRSSRILKLFRALFRRAAWDSGFSEHSPIAQAWKSYTRAISQACRKEVKPSLETMDLVARALSSFQSIWAGATTSLNADMTLDADGFIDRFRFISITFIKAVGPIPFTEKLLSKPNHGGFQAAGTPQHLPREDRTLKIPIVHYLEFILPTAEQFTTSSAYLDLVKNVLRAIVDPRSTRQWTLSLCRQCAETIQFTFPLPSHERSQSSLYTWQAIATYAETALLSTEPEQGKDGKVDTVDQSEDILRLLKIGSTFESERHAEWDKLLEATVATVRRDHGEQYLISKILEPLAEYLTSQPNEASIICATRILNLVQIRQEICQSGKKRKSVSTNPLANGKLGSSFSYERILSMLNDFLSLCYQASDFKDDLIVPELVDAVIKLLKACLAETLGLVLQNLQRGLGHWLRDTERSLVPESHAGKFKMLVARRLSGSIAMELQRLPSHCSTQLSDLQDLLTSGFEGSHSSTVNRFIDMWNSTFGTEPVLEYPPTVERALRRYANLTNLNLPNFPTLRDAESTPEPLDLIQSQDDDRYDHFHRLPPIVSSPLRAISPLPALPGDRRSRTPNSSKRVLTRTPPKAKLRHDNSQIQFVAVESSPLLGSEAESQALTERQKEVKERQKAETATMFRDLRSSPVQITRLGRSTSRRLSLPPVLASDDRGVNGLPSTPVLAKQTEDPEDVVPSSPTPRSRLPTESLVGLELGSSPNSAPNVDEAIMDIDPPSSPPGPTNQYLSNVGRLSSSPVYASIEDETNILPSHLHSSLAHPYTPTKRLKGLRNNNEMEHWTLTSTVEETPESSARNNESSVPTSVVAQEKERLASPDLLKVQAGHTVGDAADDPFVSQHDAVKNITPPLAAEESCAAEDRPRGLVAQQKDQLDSYDGPNTQKACASSPQYHISSDSAEQQIASQLEEELERSISVDVMPVSNVPDVTSSPIARSRSQSRKRKRDLEDNSVKPDDAKRAAGSIAAERTPSLAHNPDAHLAVLVPRGPTASSPAPAGDDTELGDCIIVDTDRSSPPLQPFSSQRQSSSSQASQTSNTSTTKRGRGRPRKVPGPEVKLERKRSLSVAGIPVDPLPSNGVQKSSSRKRWTRSRSVRGSSPLHNDVDTVLPTISDGDSQQPLLDTDGGSSLAANDVQQPAQDESATGPRKADPVVQEGTPEPGTTQYYSPEAPKSRAVGTSNQSQPAKQSPHKYQPEQSEIFPLPAPATLESKEMRSVSVQTEAAPEAQEPVSDGWMLGSLKKILGSLRTATVGRTAHREIDDVLFEIRKEVGRAGDRHVE